MRRSWVVWIALAVAAVAAIGVAGWVRHREILPAPVAAPASPGSAPAPPPVTLKAQGPSVGQLGTLLDGDDGFAADAIYLVAASVYARCHPEHAHELGRMAARARLPVLDGAGHALGDDAGMRRAFLAGVHDLATSAPCGRAFTMAFASFQRVIDPDGYARAFPDSYFDATLASPPMDAAGRSLAERGTDQCGSVVYAVLPLDQPYAWQCTGLRAQARARVLSICHQSGDEADADAAKIQDVVNRLPATCR